MGTNETMTRAATEGDLGAINAIYNHAIVHSNATFDTVEKTLDERREWWAAHGEHLPVLVAERDGEVVGWASLNKFDPREAYHTTAELSIYLAEAARGKRIGTQLMAALLDTARRTKLRAIIARITEGNEASVRLHERAGFRRVGAMVEVGRKFDRYWDVLIMQYLIDRP
ncbi:MAG: N-acetyltransferase family protein [Candidatus Hydrogenedentota bacterium]